jgi:hypothetical protein
MDEGRFTTENTEDTEVLSGGETAIPYLGVLGGGKT